VMARATPPAPARSQRPYVVGRAGMGSSHGSRTPSAMPAMSQTHDADAFWDALEQYALAPCSIESDSPAPRDGRRAPPGIWTSARRDEGDA
jgi:hypothetical protein